MTSQEMHEYNKSHAIARISYPAVGNDKFIIKMRKWIEEWLSLAYEAGYKAAKEGNL